MTLQLPEAMQDLGDTSALGLLLSVNVPSRAAHQLLISRTEEFHELLVVLGPDRDLVEEAQPLANDWAGWRVDAVLRSLPGVGPHGQLHAAGA